MRDIFGLALALLSGILLGVIFFGGLWWTVKYRLSSRRAGLWFSGSLLVRVAITVGGFYLVSQGSWKRTLACLFGYLLARFIISGTVAKLPRRTIRTAREAHHAH